MSGFYAIGISHTKTAVNVGTLWRSASLFGAAFIFTVGRRYQKQPSDTVKAWRSIPLFNFATITDLRDHLPFDCRLVGVELDDGATPIEDYAHPNRCCYLLGAEDHGLTTEELLVCHQLVRLPGERSMNVAVAGSIVLFDRQQKALVARRERRAA
jgi:tRNA G18 (ribose-2'-O)-methylase SpoU